MPRADIALKIARALQVPLEWLVDDEQDWPPPPSTTAAALSNEQLAAELGNRLLGVGRALLAKILRAEETNWFVVAKELLPIPVAEKLPRKLDQLARLPSQIQALVAELDQYDPTAPVGETAPADLLRFVRPDYLLSLTDLAVHASRLVAKPGYSAVADLAGLRNVPEEFQSPSLPDHIAYVREAVAKKLGILSEPSAKPAPRKSSRQ